MVKNLNEILKFVPRYKLQQTYKTTYCKAVSFLNPQMSLRTCRVLNKDPYNSQCLPLHISVLVELKKSNCKLNP